MDAKLLFTQTLSPLHAGTGQGVGVIDLPIAREKATNLPYLPGSSLKGVLRDACQDDGIRKNVFGPDTSHADEHAGSIHITDQRLLLMPIRSLMGTFAWTTSPFVLRRFLRDAGLISGTDFPSTVPDLTSNETCLVTNNTKIKGNDNSVILEDLKLLSNPDELADLWADKIAQAVFPSDTEWGAFFKERFCITNDEVFGFLVETATEVVARIALEDATKTVKRGALWYEESLPAETILSGLIVASPIRQSNLDAESIFNTISTIIDQPLQLGGSATVGRGICRLSMR